MESRRFVRPPARYAPPTKPLSFHRNIFQGTVHRERIFGQAPNPKENYVFHRDMFQPLGNVLPSRLGEVWPCITSSYGRPDNTAQSLGLLILFVVCCIMFVISSDALTDEGAPVKMFEQSMVGQDSKVIGADLLGKPK